MYGTGYKPEKALKKTYLGATIFPNNWKQSTSKSLNMAKFLLQIKHSNINEYINWWSYILPQRRSKNTNFLSTIRQENRYTNIQSGKVASISIRELHPGRASAIKWLCRQKKISPVCVPGNWENYWVQSH